MSTRIASRLRIIVKVVVTVVAVATMGGCAGAGASEDAPAGPIVIGTTATAAEPRPGLTVQSRDDLVAYALTAKKPEAATVYLVVPGAGKADTVDLTPMRKDEVENVPERRAKLAKEAVDELANSLAEAAADTENLDLLSLLDLSSRQASSGHLVLISSGIQTADPLDMRQLGWNFRVDAIVNDLVERQLIPDLTGLEITFVGLGDAAGTQPELASKERTVVEALWLGVCWAGQADDCRVADTALADEPPTSTRAIPVVPVMQYETFCVKTLPPLPADVLFAGNSAELHSGADSVLHPLAAKLAEAARRCPTSVRVDLIGHAADTHPRRLDGQQLSIDRARAVADRLIALGAPQEAIGHVTGHGDSQPLVLNWSEDGEFEEALAARNRRVELIVVASDDASQR